MVLSAIAVILTISDRHGSITSSRTHVPRLCCFHRDDLRRTSASPQMNEKREGLRPLFFYATMLTSVI